MHGLVGDLSEVEIVSVRQPGSVAVALRSGSSGVQPVALDLLVLVYRVVWRGTDGSRSCAGVTRYDSFKLPDGVGAQGSA